MFAKSNRFSFRRGAPRKVYQTPYFVICYEKINEKQIKCAVVVGKKVDKRAVVRNKIKRQIIKNIKELVPMNNSHMIVIYAKKSVLEIDNELAKEILNNAFKILKII